MNAVSIQLLGDFSITVNGERHDYLAAKSRKGVSLLIYLILQQGKPVSTQRLIREMWSRDGAANPESALKTMVSRLRAHLNALSDGLGGCIQSSQGSYRWQCLKGVRVDALDFLDSLQSLKRDLPVEEQLEKYRQAQALYQGDLSQTDGMVNGVIYLNWMHREYLETMYHYIHLLRQTGSHREIQHVCDQALKIDRTDEFFRVERAKASAAMSSQEGAVASHPAAGRESEGTLDRQLAVEYKLQDRLADMTHDLARDSGSQKGPFFCEYGAFREICGAQLRSLERLGATVFLCLITVDGAEGSISAVTRESAMAGLREILRRSLRKGDVVTRYAPDIFALMLPSVTYNTIGMVLDRIDNMFSNEYPNNKVVLYHRVTSLSG